MKSMNRIQLIGWLGRDISVRTSRNGKLFASFRMATDRWFRNEKGITIKKTSWHTVWIWDPQKAAVSQHYLVKGSHVLVEGIMNYRNYTDKTGRYVQVAEVKASTIIDLDR